MMRSLPVLMVLSMMLFGASVPGAWAGTILFDKGHGERFVPDDTGPLQLSGLADIMARQGLKVETVGAPLTDRLLAGADALVISGPFTPLTDAEAEAVLRFLGDGGKLAVMLHIGSPAAGLLHRLGLDVSNRPVQEQHNVISGNPLDFKVTALDEESLLTGLSSFSLYGGWALLNTQESTRLIASTSPEAWIDLNGDGKLSAGDAVGTFGVVASGRRGYGRYVVFGDDAIFQNRFLDDDNLRLAANLAHWLGGKRLNGEDGEPMLRGLQAP